MTGRSVLLCGATGLVGGECLRLLGADPTISRIVALTHRPLPDPLRQGGGTADVEERIVDFDRLEASTDVMQVDQVICALGTTIRKAGSRARFRQVDFGYPLEIARLARAQGAGHVLLVSAAGAHEESRVFYSRVKGELENALQALSFRSLTIVRPSVLLGEREESRLGETIAGRLSFLFPASYRPVAASDVAAALVRAAREDRAGLQIIESKDIEALG